MGIKYSNGYGCKPNSFYKALPKLSGSACKAADIIASKMPNDWSKDCFVAPSVVKENKMSKPTFYKGIQELEDNGVIEVDRAHRQTNIYKWLE